MNPYILLLFGTILGSTAGIFIKYLNLPATSIAFLRLSVPLLLTFIYLKHKKIKLFTKNYKVMLLASLFNAIRLFFYFIAFLYTSMTNAILILFTWPIFAALFGVFILKEKITKRQILLFILAFLGIIIMNIGKNLSMNNKDMIGMGAMLISAIVLAITNVSYKRVIAEFSNAETIFYQNFIGAFLFLPFIFINRPFPTINEWGLGIIYASLIGIVVFIFLFSAMREIKMIQYSLFKYLEIVFNIIFGILFFSEQITFQTALGGAIIIFVGIIFKKNIANKNTIKTFKKPNKNMTN